MMKKNVMPTKQKAFQVIEKGKYMQQLQRTVREKKSSVDKERENTNLTIKKFLDDKTWPGIHRN